jgi:predicted DsbA family dithiol-disulfide isomerase
MAPVRAVHFSDALCVWAYVSQVRIEELRKEFGEDIEITCRFAPVFGDARGKLEKSWSDRGGLSGYGAFVRDVVGGFDHVEVHPDIWRKVAPPSSLSCHVFLCAARHLERDGDLGEPGLFDRVGWALRKAFFVELQDISQRQVQLGIAEKLGLPVAAIESCMDSGVAHAELSADYTLARDYRVEVSPTLILDGGRQRLNGNVGYRVLEANVRELMHKAGADEASWC